MRQFGFWLMAFEESFLQVTSHRRQLWFTITVIIRVGCTSLGTALTNKSKLLEWSRRRTYSKQRFPALSHRVLLLEITFQRCKLMKVKLVTVPSSIEPGVYLAPLKEPTKIH